jgi:hypothetical protein
MRGLWTLVLVGCGGAVTTSDAGVDATTSDVADASIVFGDDVSSTKDAAPIDVNIGLVDGGGPFMCDQVVCDGRTQYCNISSVGPPGPAHCSQLPDGCVPASCECLPNANLGQGCSCAHATTGDGLIAGCQAP